MTTTTTKTSFLGATMTIETIRKSIETADTLSALCDALNRAEADAVTRINEGEIGPRVTDYCDVTSLPTFDPDAPEDTEGVYSWDSGSVLRYTGDDTRALLGGEWGGPWHVELRPYEHLLARVLGYETVRWSDEHGHYEGTGSFVSMDRSREDMWLYICESDDEADEILKRAAPVNSDYLPRDTTVGIERNDRLTTALVERDGQVRLYDDVSDSYTLHHDLSDMEIEGIRAEAAARYV